MSNNDSHSKQKEIKQYFFFSFKMLEHGGTMEVPASQRSAICNVNQTDLSCSCCLSVIYIHFFFISLWSNPLLPPSRWDSWHTAGPEDPAGLREQQRGPQYRQHAKHPLLQQQHGVAQDATRRDAKPRRGTGRARQFTGTGLLISIHDRNYFWGMW